MSLSVLIVSSSSSLSVYALVLISLLISNAVLACMFSHSNLYYMYLSITSIINPIVNRSTQCTLTEAGRVVELSGVGLTAHVPQAGRTSTYLSLKDTAASMLI